MQNFAKHIHAAALLWWFASHSQTPTQCFGASFTLSFFHCYFYCSLSLFAFLLLLSSCIFHIAEEPQFLILLAVHSCFSFVAVKPTFSIHQQIFQTFQLGFYQSVL